MDDKRERPMDDKRERLLLVKIAKLLLTQAKEILDWRPDCFDKPKLMQCPLLVDEMNLENPSWPFRIIERLSTIRFEPGSHLKAEWKGVLDLHAYASECLKDLPPSTRWLVARHDLDDEIRRFETNTAPNLFS
jgi:hypothetical protein